MGELTLADARIAADQHRLSLSLFRGLVLVEQGGELGVAPHQLIEFRVQRWSPAGLFSDRHGSDEPVSASVECADVEAGIVAKRPAGLGHGFLQHGLGGVDPRPHRRMQLFLRNDAIAMLDEVSQHAHRLRLERRDVIPAKEQVDVRSKVEGRETKRRRSRRGGHGDVPGWGTF